MEQWESAAHRPQHGVVLLGKRAIKTRQAWIIGTGTGPGGQAWQSVGFPDRGRAFGVQPLGDTSWWGRYPSTGALSLCQVDTGTERKANHQATPAAVCHCVSLWLPRSVFVEDREMPDAELTSSLHRMWLLFKFYSSTLTPTPGRKTTTFPFPNKREIYSQLQNSSASFHFPHCLYAYIMQFHILLFFTLYFFML